MSLRLLVEIWVRDARFEEFAAFETAAFAIMAKYGGEVVLVEQNHTKSEGGPHEIHHLNFPNEAAFAAYRKDPALLDMARIRERCIAKTVVETRK